MKSTAFENSINKKNLTLGGFLSLMQRRAVDSVDAAEGMGDDQVIANDLVYTTLCLNRAFIGALAAQLRRRHPEFVASRSDIPWDHLVSFNLDRVLKVDPVLVLAAVKTDFPSLILLLESENSVIEI
ncbi:MAG: hypothetical protein PF483_07975 [Halothiobacillus sp.]|jgi:hypothetical protein|nr:hypothetical protein [Halothiobacillus sp.]